MKDRTIQKLLWAVDLNGDEGCQNRAAQAIRLIVAATHARVEPVFVLTPSGFRVSATHVPKWAEAYGALAEKRLAEVVSRCELPGIGHPTVLVEHDRSIRKAVRRILDHARAEACELIVVSTQAKKGVSRFFLGSFAETLVLQSDVPILTTNPATESLTAFSRILFPTDFSQPSRRGFEATVSLSKQLGAKLWLYHKTPPLTPFPYPEAPIYYDYADDEENLCKETAKAWVDWARTRAVEVALTLDDEPGDAATAIVDFAKAQKIEMIAMVTQSSPLASVVLGSVARQIVRNATCPVWIQHSKI